MAIDFGFITQTLAALIFGVAAGFYGLRYLRRDWKATGVETSLITLLHTELERLTTQNATMAEELNKLQTEVIKLNQQLFVLTMENQKLHMEVSQLTEEINRLHGMLPAKEK